MNLRLPARKLVRSTLAPFNVLQRWVSYVVWGLWLLNFLFWELTGTLPFTPWRTLSETGWDIDDRHPKLRGLLSSFLFGLAIHIRYRDTLTSSYAYGQALVAELDQREVIHEKASRGRQGPLGEP